MSATKKITVTVLTKNSEKYIIDCLSSLSKFNEVVILDNGSEDNTLSLASKFNNVSIFVHEFIGFGPMKNIAAEKSSNEWILSIDSDEVLSDDLLSSIDKLDLNDKKIVYGFKRLNHYNKKPILCCGWDNDIVMRLYNKNYTKFTDSMVHEKIQYKKDTHESILNGNLLHYPFDDATSLLDKIQRYSSLYATQSNKISSPTKAVIHAGFSFFKNYFLQKGILHGYEGLLISISNANGVFYKYIKLYEKHKRR
jgi:glycosyltransferase involved in cell wall biosynthesis